MKYIAAHLVKILKNSLDHFFVIITAQSIVETLILWFVTPKLAIFAKLPKEEKWSVRSDKVTKGSYFVLHCPIVHNVPYPLVIHPTRKKGDSLILIVLVRMTPALSKGRVRI